MSTGPTHKHCYRNVGLDSQELRRRRQEEKVQLREQKREQQLSKRRNVPNTVADDDNVTASDEYTLPTQQSQSADIITPEMVDALYSPNTQEQLAAMQEFGKLFLREPNPPIDEEIQTKIVPQLVDFLKNDTNRTLQIEAAWVLGNIASETSEQTRVVIDAEAREKVKSLLENETAECERRTAVYEKCIREMKQMIREEDMFKQRYEEVQEVFQLIKSFRSDTEKDMAELFPSSFPKNTKSSLRIRDVD